MNRLLLLFAVLAQSAVAEPPPRDWSATLREDARAFHDTIAANHAGPVNRLDPGFARRNDRALVIALARATRVTDYAGYLWATRGYVASFDDGHVGVSVEQTPDMAIRWPGFLTGYDARDRQVVRTRADDAPVPLGAELVGCDGQAAKMLAARQVGAFSGRWSLRAQRIKEGGRLLIDAGNPFVARSRRCTFRVAGATRTIDLAWRAMSYAEWQRHFVAMTARAHLPIGARTLSDGTRWFALSGFDGSPDGDNAKTLVPLIAAMKRDRAAIEAAPAIVLDLRGNNGGSSDWSAQIAAVLWGRQRVDRVPGSRGVDWRVSPANLATITAYRDSFARAPDASDEVKRHSARRVAGMTAAAARGDALYRETDEPAVPIAGPVPTPPVGPVYVLTDYACASACLDAVDL